jgi:hypothetical protein
LLIFLGFQAMLAQATLVYASPERFLSRLEQAPPTSVSFDTVLDFVVKPRSRCVWIVAGEARLCS